MTVQLPLLVELGVFIYLFGLITGYLAPKAWQLGKRIGNINSESLGE